MSFLEFDKITFGYGQNGPLILKNLSFSVEKGDFVTIIGASGCGKSTLFRLINGLEKDYTGEIRIDGKDIRSLSDYASFMPQKDLLMPWRTVKKNVELPLEAGKFPKRQREELAVKALETAGLSGYENKLPSELSGGMRQRVSFARTLLCKGELMLLDEPFSALDSVTRTSMQAWLSDTVNKLDRTVVMITHDVNEALLLGNKVYLMNEEPVSDLTVFDSSYIKNVEDLPTEKAALLCRQLTERLSRIRESEGNDVGQN